MCVTYSRHTGTISSRSELLDAAKRLYSFTPKIFDASVLKNLNPSELNPPSQLAGSSRKFPFNLTPINFDFHARALSHAPPPLTCAISIISKYLVTDTDSGQVHLHSRSWSPTSSLFRFNFQIPIGNFKSTNSLDPDICAVWAGGFRVDLNSSRRRARPSSQALGRRGTFQPDFGHFGFNPFVTLPSPESPQLCSLPAWIKFDSEFSLQGSVRTRFNVRNYDLHPDPRAYRHRLAKMAISPDPREATSQPPRNVPGTSPDPICAICSCSEGFGTTDAAATVKYGVHQYRRQKRRRKHEQEEQQAKERQDAMTEGVCTVSSPPAIPQPPRSRGADLYKDCVAGAAHAHGVSSSRTPALPFSTSTLRTAHPRPTCSLSWFHFYFLSSCSPSRMLIAAHRCTPVPLCRVSALTLVPRRPSLNAQTYLSSDWCVSTPNFSSLPFAAPFSTTHILANFFRSASLDRTQWFSLTPLLASCPRRFSINRISSNDSEYVDSWLPDTTAVRDREAQKFNEDILWI
ncbi:hypothetical protein DFH06DRAFT_1311261 [Mycena polygramma]|nr:hypothetical protein DFH06DRAFT_1311261 [Mycena polygramma]